jgi:hypothetical protein
VHARARQAARRQAIAELIFFCGINDLGRVKDISKRWSINVCVCVCVCVRVCVRGTANTHARVNASCTHPCPSEAAWGRGLAWGACTPPRPHGGGSAAAAWRRVCGINDLHPPTWVAPQTHMPASTRHAHLRGRMGAGHAHPPHTHMHHAHMRTHVPRPPPRAGQGRWRHGLRQAHAAARRRC